MKRKNADKRMLGILLVLVLMLPFSSRDVVYAGQTYEALKSPENTIVKQTGTKGLLLTWKKVKDAKGYEVYKGVGNLGGYKKVKTVKKTKYMDKHVKLGRSGTYKVRAYKYSKGKKVYSKYTYPVSAKVCRETDKRQNAASPEIIFDSDTDVFILGVCEPMNKDYEKFFANVRGPKKKKGKGRYKPLNSRLRWYSTDPSVVKVKSKTDIVAGKKPGKAYVYAIAHNGKRSNKIPVVVKDYAYEKVDIKYAPGELQVLFNLCEKQIRDVCSYYSKHNNMRDGEYHRISFNGEEYSEGGNAPLRDKTKIPIIKKILEASPFESTAVSIYPGCVEITVYNSPVCEAQLWYWFKRHKELENYFREISPHWYYDIIWHI